MALNDYDVFISQSPRGGRLCENQKGIYYHCEVIPVQKMLDINLTGIKYGLE